MEILSQADDTECRMPTYEYECKHCGHLFERFQSMMEDPVKKCPECDGEVKRLISSGAGLIFKGSGFYITDYKKTRNSVQDPTKNKDESSDSASSSTKDKKKEDKADSSASSKKTN